MNLLLQLIICWLYFLLDYKTLHKEVSKVWPNCIWWWGFSFGDWGRLDYPFIVRVVVPVMILSMDQIDVCKKNFVFNRIMRKKKPFRNQYTRNVNMNLQWMQFPDLLKWNNTKRVDMSLKSISQSISLTYGRVMLKSFVTVRLLVK